MTYCALQNSGHFGFNFDQTLFFAKLVSAKQIHIKHGLHQANLSAVKIITTQNIWLSIASTVTFTVHALLEKITTVYVSWSHSKFNSSDQNLAEFSKF